MMELSLTCTRCGNRCLEPPPTGRDYACPRCGRLLPRPTAAGFSLIARVRRVLSLQARYTLLLVALFGTGLMGVRAGLMGRRPAAGPEQSPRPVSLIPLNEQERSNYEYRLRQLERDLQRDGGDFDVLRRLGQLHLRLASCQVEGRFTHLRQARHYLRRAQEVAFSYLEAGRVRMLLEVANSPNPVGDIAVPPGDFGPPPRVDEDSVRVRIGFWQELIGWHPRSSRARCRLADNYVALLVAMGNSRHTSSTRSAGIPSWPGASTISDPAEAQRLAQESYHRALECALTVEARAKALYGEAQLYRSARQPARAAAFLQRLLEIQPNNWLAAMELSWLCRQLDQPQEANRYQRQSERWRTPGWL
jgi:DNA-directed RNA polymerase subunit RPC12/RpoP